MTDENNKRIEILHKKYSKKLINYANTITNNMEDAEDIYSNMLLYLLEKTNKKLYNDDCFNIGYIYKIIQSRSINFINSNKNIELNEQITENIDEDYDYENDKQIEDRLDIILAVIKNLKSRRIDKYFQYYEKFYLYKMKIKTLAKKANVSTNTLYIHFKKIQQIVNEEVKAKSLLIENETVNN